MTGLDVRSLYQRIGQAMIEGAPRDWIRLVVDYRQAGETGQWQSAATTADESSASLRHVPLDMDRAFRDLRGALYQEGKGAWYSATATVTRDGRITIDVDYDNEPQWHTPVVPLTYVEDLEMFPRDLEHQPAWLRERIREAGA